MQKQYTGMKVANAEKKAYRFGQNGPENWTKQGLIMNDAAE